jgi:multiple sugar transport system permease protein
MVLPTMAFYVVFTLGPALAAFALAFYHWNYLTPPTFAGLANFRTLVDDDRLAEIVRNTLLFTVCSVTVKVVLGFLIATFIWSSRSRFVTALLESAVFIPVVLPMTIVALVWGLFLNTDSGIINGLLGNVGLPRAPWLTNGHWALASIILIDVWKQAGFFVVIYLAALRNIPRQLVEAAELDGAGPSRRMWSLLRPLVSPTTFFLIVIGTIGSLQVFDQSYILTNGGPGDATRTIVYYLWELAFQRLDVGYATTVTLLLFLLIGAATVLQFRMSRRWVNY